jgi:quinol monooxygenase YgiN
MYGTVARFQVKPGAEADLERFSREDIPAIAGLVMQYAYRTDANPNELYLVVGFESKAAYQANASSPEQHARYERYRELLTAEPEWHDGEIIFSHPTKG